MTDERPQRIGRYEVITRLAIGGMAELFLARERGIAGLERVVVLKRILPHLADKPSFVDMFLREARIAARLAHPNVVQIFDLGEEGGTFYIAMEYINGTTVRELQVLCEQQHRRFPLDVTISVIVQSLRGLQAAHELTDLEGRQLGLVHRDISPHNLMCTADGNVKLLDFGVAKATEEGLESTHSGNLKGKYAYMSPEQARRKELDRRSDLFGIGVVTWEMLTGSRLFRRDSELEMMEAVLSGDVVPPSALNPKVPRPIEELVMRALAMDREQRWSSAHEMGGALSEAASVLNLDVSPDRLARFVREVAGQHLSQRREVLQLAMERSLTSHEKQDLLHVTGSSSEVSANTELDLPLALKLTREAVDSRKRDDAGATGETLVSKHLTGDISRDVAPTQAARVSRGRLLMLAIVLLGLLGAAGLLANELISDQQKAAVQEPVLLGDPLPWAWSPTVDPEILAAEIAPLRAFLEKKTGRPMPFQVTKSYQESSQMLLDGRVAFAMLPPYMYIGTRQLDERIEPIAIKVFDGALHSDGYLLVRGDSGIEVLADLEGKTFCFPDKNSTTGNFLPRSFIRKQGHDPEQFIGEVRWSGDHIQALRDVVDKKCDAAAVYSGAFISADQLAIPVSQLRTLAITGNVPQDAVVAGSGVSEADKQTIRDALKAFDPQVVIGESHLGKTQRVTGFEPTTDEAYEFLRTLIKEHRGDIADVGASE